MRKWLSVLLAVLILPVLTGCSKVCPLPSEMLKDAPVTRAPWAAGADSGASAEAFMKASGAGKFLFVYLYTKGKNEPKFRKAFDAALKTLADRADGTVVDLQNPKEAAFIGKYRLQQAPMPLVLAFAPNGAMTGGFPRERIGEQGMVGTLASPVLQRCLKALQDGKMILVCSTVADATGKIMIPKGVRDFQADPKNSDRSTIIRVDPTDVGEQKLLSMLQLNPTAKMSTCLLAPPGSMVSKWVGPVKKKDIEEALDKASSGAGMRSAPPQGAPPPNAPPQGGPGGPGGPAPSSNPPPR